MKKHHIRSASTYLLAALVFISCTKEKQGVVDVSHNSPRLLNASIQPNSVNIDVDTVNVDSLGNGNYRIRTSVSARALDPDGTNDITALSYAVYSPRSTNPLAAGVLPLSSSPGDTIIFSSQLTFVVNRENHGNYSIVFQAVDKSNLSSNVLKLNFAIRRNNSVPILGTPSFRQFTPDGSDSTRLTVSIAVSDSDGIDDINLVSVRALNTTDSSSRPMFDDGLAIHGDVFPGDGIYSAIFWIQPTGPLHNVTLEFLALDRNGAVSTPVRRTLQNSPPRIIRLSVPDSIQRPTTGFRLIPFFATVFDPDGLADIDSVYFRNISSQNPTNILMFDDGNLVAHGDSVANDGTYSRIVSIDSSTSLGDKEFHFHAVDRAGARDLVIRIIRIYQ